MPKMKTKRAAAKRFKTTGTGKLMKMNANTSHILNKKTMNQNRLSQPDFLSSWLFSVG